MHACGSVDKYGYDCAISKYTHLSRQAVCPVVLSTTHTPSLSMWVTTLLFIYPTDDSGIVMPTHMMSDRAGLTTKGSGHIIDMF